MGRITSLQVQVKHLQGVLEAKNKAIAELNRNGSKREDDLRKELLTADAKVRDLQTQLASRPLSVAEAGA